MSQGANANANGMRLEKRIECFFINNNISYNKQHKYESIYGHTGKMDFYLDHLDLAIEAKNQEGAGSVCEKLPYVLENFEQHPAKKGLLILGGAFWPTKPGILSWVRKKADKSDKNIQVIFFDEIESWFEQTKNWA